MQSQYKSQLLTLAIAVSSALAADAVPAKRTLMPMTQPDGSTVTVSLAGDEFSHHYFTEDGYLLVSEGQKLCYARVGADGLPVSTGLEARDVTARTAAETTLLAGLDPEQLRTAASSLDSFRRRTARIAQRNPFLTPTPAPTFTSTDSYTPLPGLFPGTNFPALGSPKVLVIIVEFSDLGFHIENPYDYFHRMLTEEGFSDYGGTGSALDYFRENSDGRFVPQFDLYGPVTLPKTCQYYGGNDWMGNDEHPEDMIIDACNLLDDQIDFTQYDTDGDGVIDNVFVFYAGRGEASGGAANTVWPHSWNVYEGAGKRVELDGVLLDRYACSNEWEGNRPDGIGTFVHEFSHVLGLPDLYATSYTGAFTPGSWSAMDYGPYNNDGCTPPYYSAFERSALGWMEPLPIDTAICGVLTPIASGRAGVIRTGKSGEYFLVENRQQTGWDAYVPGHGMLIWHVDYNESVWNSNTVNNSSSHQYVDIEEADNSRNEYSRDGDAFPGTKGVTSFTDSTTPSMRTWGGKQLGLPITDIAESDDGIITFKVLGGSEPLEPLAALPSSDCTLYSFTANWVAVEGANHMLSVYTRDGDGEPSYIDGYRHRNVGQVASHTVEGLDPNTEYYYTVTYGTAWEMAPESDEILALTSGSGIWRKQVVTLPAEEVTDSTFTARWEMLDDATDYLLTVSQEIDGVPSAMTCGFDDGVTALPEGWSASTATSYSMASYSGEAVPSLRMGKTADYIEAGGYDDGISSVIFWSRGNGSKDSDSLRISAFAEGQWTPVRTVAIERTKGGVITEVDGMPYGTSAVRITYLRVSGAGSVAIDDIAVMHGSNRVSVPLAAYESISVGNTDRYTVTGLIGDTPYNYMVRATDGELFSRFSESLPVTTSNSNAIEGIISESGISVTADGLLVTAAGMADGTPVRIYDPMGRLVATAATPESGRVTLRVPSEGIYIVQCGQETFRIAACH